MVHHKNKGNFPTRSQIIDFVRDNAKDTSKRQIVRAFALHGDSRVRLKRELNSLVEEGLLEKSRGRRFRDPTNLPKVATVEIYKIDKTGELHCKLSQIEISAAKYQVVIPLKALKIARSSVTIGTKLLVRLKQVSENYYEAKVISRIGGPDNRIIGTVVRVGDEDRIRLSGHKKREYRVESSDKLPAIPGDIVQAELYPSSRAATRPARITNNFGRAENSGSLSKITMAEYGIGNRFSAEVMSELEHLTVPELEGREDLRDLPLVTIDPENARDHDDAVWAGADANPDNEGGWQIVVAIADVAHYVTPDSQTDLEALRRGNSVYFPDQVVPMLPQPISENACSLRQHSDRPALVVHISINSKGDKQSHKFTRAIVRIKDNLNYEQVQAVKDSAPDSAKTSMMGTVNELFGAHAALRQARAQRQPLEIYVPERKITVDAQGNIAHLETRKNLESHRLIEDFMILANVCAAETLESAKALCMYRVHDRPDREKLASLGHFLKRMNVPFTANANAKPASFNELLRVAREMALDNLLNQVVLRAQSQACYSPNNIGHFGLALTSYAHFTSPIRRYADLLVHRAIISVCKLGTGGLLIENKAEMNRIGENLSATERQAMAAERASVDRFVALYFGNRIGQIFPGYVSGVSRFGLFVTLRDYHSDGLVPIRSLGNEFFRYEEPNNRLVGELSGAIWQLGDTLHVKLLESDPILGRLRFKIMTGAKTDYDSIGARQ